MYLCICWFVGLLPCCLALWLLMCQTSASLTIYVFACPCTWAHVSLTACASNGLCVWPSDGMLVWLSVYLLISFSEWLYVWCVVSWPCRMSVGFNFSLSVCILWVYWSLYLIICCSPYLSHGLSVSLSDCCLLVWLHYYLIGLFVRSPCLKNDLPSMLSSYLMAGLFGMPIGNLATFDIWTCCITAIHSEGLVFCYAPYLTAWCMVMSKRLTFWFFLAPRLPNVMLNWQHRILIYMRYDSTPSWSPDYSALWCKLMLL